MIDLQKVEFSEDLSRQRIARAKSVLGDKVIIRLICFALYLLGMKRTIISEVINLPTGTVQSTIKAFYDKGLSALEDRRKKSSSFLPNQKEESIVTLSKEEHGVTITFKGTNKIMIPAKNSLQEKVILLTLHNNKLMKTREIIDMLGFSGAHTLNLSKGLHSQDVSFLIDQRKGQREDYRVGQTEKGEIIRQFSARTVSGLSTSSEIITEKVNEHTNNNLSSRTIRWHMNKLGLQNLRKTLPELVTALKKNSK
jgi:hypothetical protein